MRNIFLDIGAHWGESLDEVLSPMWAFDVVYAFEPEPEAVSILKDKFQNEIHSGRLVLVPAALSNKDGTATLFGANTGGGATLLKDKIDIDASIARSIDLISATDFFRANLTKGDNIIAKFNCEGGEVDILTELCSSGEIHKISGLVVDFDIRKVRGRKRDAALTVKRMRAAGFDRFVEAQAVMVGPNHRARMRNAFANLPAAVSACRTKGDLPSPPLKPKLTRRLRHFIRAHF